MFPNEYGIQKHPLFFLPCFKKKDRKMSDIDQNSSQSQINNTSGNYELNPYLSNLKVEYLLKSLKLSINL